MKPEKMINIDALPADRSIPDTLRGLFAHFIRQVPLLLIVMFCFNAAVAVLNALMPYFIGIMIDIMADGAADPAQAFEELMPVLVTFIGLCLVFKPVVNVIGDFFAIGIFVPHFGNLVRRQAHWYTLRHSLAYFQDDFAGRIANKVQQMGPAVRDVLTHSISAVMYVGVFMLSTGVLMMQADIVLIIPMLVWLFLYALILYFFVPRVRRKSIELSDAQSRLVGRIVDSYTNIMTVKLFARKKHEDDFVLDALHHHSEKFRGKNYKVYTMVSLLNIINALMIGVVTVQSLWLWRGGAITPGDVAMVLPLAIQINNQMHWIMWEMTTIFEWLGMAEDSMSTISKPHRVTDEAGATPLQVTKGDVLFDNVTFHYGKGSGVLDNFTLHIPPGQKVGLVGHSGAGKSTVASLLLRFYDLEGGRILIDGQDIAVHTQDSLRSHIAMVTQDTSLLHRSITDNIRYGRPEATQEQIIEAAKKAQAHDFILGLEDNYGRKGYEAHVGERGVKLSGGQRQRIAIARIILKNAPILILDEATSALDSETENYIQDQLETLMQNKTVIAIAHRLSTIARMDRLIIMDHGKIVEDGSHEELLKIESGHYARMWALQSGGFLPE